MDTVIYDDENTNMIAEPEKTVEIVREFANVDRYHLRPGLFQASRGKRRNEPLELVYELKNGGSLEISSIHPLRPFDAILLCLVICRAAQNQTLLGPTPKTKIGQELREKLELLESSVFKTCLTYRTSARRLIANLGLIWHGSVSIKKIEESLRRMFKVSFILTRIDDDGKKEIDMFHLMSYVRLVSKGKNAEMILAIDPILANALINPMHYATIDMESLKMLSSCDTQQLLFIELCNLIDPGKKRSFTIERLRELIYGSIDNETAKNASKQNMRTKDHLAGIIEKLDGWKSQQIDDLIWIERPYIKGYKPKRQKKKKQQKI